MLGDSGAGKTTYMAVMYRFMNQGHRGFKIGTDNGRHHKELLRDAADIRGSRYPGPTSIRESYDFTLSYRGKRVSSFTWADYRGGALSDRSSDEQASALVADLRDADAIVVFADAQRMAVWPGASASAIRVGQFVQQAVARRCGPTPLVLCFTKADLISGPGQWHSAFQSYWSLIRAAEISKARVRFTAVAISCGSRSRGEQMPVLWCLGHHISAEVDRLSACIAATKAEAEAAARKAGILNSLQAWWNDEESEWRKNQRLLKEAEAQLETLLPLKAPAKALTKRLGREQRRHAPPGIAPGQLWWLR